MALLAGEIAEIVWAETRAFGEAAGDGSGNVNGVRRLVAVLAASTAGAGFDRRESLPSVDDRRYGETARAIMRIAEDAKAVTTPQNRLIIWETNDESADLNSRTDPPPPAPWGELAPGQIITHLRQQLLPNGNTVDVLATARETGDDGAVFVNALTGTGVPDGRAPMAQIKPTTAARPKLGFWLFVAASVLFVLSRCAPMASASPRGWRSRNSSSRHRLQRAAPGPSLLCAATASEQSTVLDTVNWSPIPTRQRIAAACSQLALSGSAAVKYPPDSGEANARITRHGPNGSRPRRCRGRAPRAPR